MLYELIAVVRPGNLAHIKEIARTAGSEVLNNRGVVRGLSNWGTLDLPRPTTKHQNRNFAGHYFVMQFDSSVSTLASVRRTLSLDPRMIRYSIVKIGDKLGGVNGRIEDIDGRNRPDEAGLGSLAWNSTGKTDTQDFRDYGNGRGASKNLLG